MGALVDTLTRSHIEALKARARRLEAGVNWFNSSKVLPGNNDNYLVYYSESGEYKICDFDGKVFSYSYWDDGYEMVRISSPNRHLWWKYLGRPE